VKGKRFLLLRADIARPALPKLLCEAGAVVEDLVVYETRPVAALPDDVLAALRQGKVDWVTFTSSSTAKNMVDLLGSERDLLSKVRIASIGPITSDTARELGLAVAVEAEQSTIPGLVAALESAVAASKVKA
jgi:uroporphyrinogen III methyltransferase/synthase